MEVIFLIVAGVVLLVALALALVELLRDQHDLALEVKWLRKAVAVLGIAVILLAVMAFGESSLQHALMTRIELSEIAIAELETMQQYQKIP